MDMFCTLIFVRYVHFSCTVCTFITNSFVFLFYIYHFSLYLLVFLYHYCNSLPVHTNKLLIKDFFLKTKTMIYFKDVYCIQT